MSTMAYKDLSKAEHEALRRIRTERLDRLFIAQDANGLWTILDCAPMLGTWIEIRSDGNEIRRN